MGVVAVRGGKCDTYFDREFYGRQTIHCKAVVLLSLMFTLK